jgi:enoyl-CoA hydratase
MDNINSVVKTKLHPTGIFEITLDRPNQLNALSRKLLEELARIFHEAKYNKSIKAILLTGTGKAFCVGADITQLAQLKKSEGLEYARFGQSVFRSLELLGKPSLAAIQGFALGGGCELAMAATLRIASDNAIFGQPEIKLGVIPGFGGTQRLARLIGKGRALEMCLTGKKFTAEVAYQWGLVNELTSSENLLSCALSLLNEIAQYSPAAIQGVMTTIQQGYNLPLDDALELEAVHFGLCCTTADKHEGVNAFLEKRTALFSGE